MSIFDDAEHGLAGVDGVLVPPEDLAEGSTSRWAPKPGAICWPVVDRWCHDHPGQVRGFIGMYGSITSKLKRLYPDLLYRQVNTRRRTPESKGWVCDLMVSYSPDYDPFENVPGFVVRTKTPGERDAATRAR